MIIFVARSGSFSPVAGVWTCPNHLRPFLAPDAGEGKHLENRFYAGRKFLNGILKRSCCGLEKPKKIYMQWLISSYDFYLTK